MAAVIQAAVLDAMVYLRLVGSGSVSMQCLDVLAVEDVDVYIAWNEVTRREEEGEQGR